MRFLDTCFQQWLQCKGGDRGLLCGLVSREAVETEVCFCFRLVGNDLNGQVNECLSVIPIGFSILGIFQISGPKNKCEVGDEPINQIAALLQDTLPGEDLESGLSLVRVRCRDVNHPSLPSSWTLGITALTSSSWLGGGDVVDDDDGDDVELESSLISRSKMTEVMCCFRLVAQIPVRFNVGDTKDESDDNLRSSLMCVDVVPTFLISGTDVLVEAEGREGRRMDLTTCSLLRQHLRTNFTNLLTQDLMDGGKTGEIMVVKMVQRLSHRGQTHVPVFDYKRAPGKWRSVCVSLDVVVYVPSDRHIADLPLIFATSLTSQLTSITNHHRGSVTSQPTHITNIPTPHIFLPSPLHHPITLVYPSNGRSVVSLSKSYQRHLMIDTAKMSLQPSFALPTGDNDDNVKANNDGPSMQKRLKNVHVGLPPSGVPGGTTHLVRGGYHYHHYLQDKMDDDGWGCAYRSLQTICSWYRLQTYHTLPVPTHTQIQQALVDVGDKPSKFVGSKLWIGSMEVGYVLSHLYQIESRYLCVNSGSELADKARELGQHFDTQGTPVMIGGGVKAHTILGVHFNDQTGDVRLLILDPHYTGGEDVGVIQRKGWCGWKTVDFFDQTSFYNLCLPQLPTHSDDDDDRDDGDE